MMPLPSNIDIADVFEKLLITEKTLHADATDFRRLVKLYVERADAERLGILEYLHGRPRNAAVYTDSVLQSCWKDGWDTAHKADKISTKPDEISTKPDEISTKPDEIKAPAGYRRLRPNEPSQQNDLWWDAKDNKWRESYWPAEVVQLPNSHPRCRKMYEDEPAPVGWYALKPNEPVKFGDRWWNRTTGLWVDVSKDRGSRLLVANYGSTVIRKQPLITLPAGWHRVTGKLKPWDKVWNVDDNDWETVVDPNNPMYMPTLIKSGVHIRKDKFIKPAFDPTKENIEIIPAHGDNQVFQVLHVEMRGDELWLQLKKPLDDPSKSFWADSLNYRRLTPMVIVEENP